MAIEYNDLTLQDFRDHGYEVYKTSQASVLEADWAFWLCQKKIWIDDDKHFINIYITDYDRKPWNEFRNFIRPNKKSYTAKIQLMRDDHTFNLDIAIGEVYDIVEIENICIRWFKFIKEV